MLRAILASLRAATAAIAVWINSHYEDHHGLDVFVPPKSRLHGNYQPGLQFRAWRPSGSYRAVARIEMASTVTCNGWRVIRKSGLIPSA